jgi:glucosamine--fructose-6-phosphate aminotransferase (isomerizing)
MCGITACVSVDDPVSRLLEGLGNLEYRGYDSAGMAVRTDEGLDVRKREGRVEQLAAAFEGSPPASGRVGIGHTRWSTHGKPSNANAHPHTDCHGRLAVVHNGIIENHDALRDRLVSAGHTFRSETDTEVVPHLVEEYLEEGVPIEAAFRRAVSELSGSYAIAMVHEESDTVYATRQGSPLVFGVDDGAYYLASDVPAFLEFTDRVVYLDDGDIVAVRSDGYELTTLDGSSVDRPVERVDWDAEEVEKGRFDHFMRKEIDEQPSALAQTVRGRIAVDAAATGEGNHEIGGRDDAEADGGEIRRADDAESAETDDAESARTDDAELVSFDSLDTETFDGVETVQFVACGTSYHAALYGAQLLRNRGVDARAYLASEYAVGCPPLDERTLLVGVTQSGETADTLEALRYGHGEGVRTLAVTNVVGSTAARECDDAVFIRAGPEIGVAATKTFSSQVATLALLAERLRKAIRGSYSDDAVTFLAAVAALPDQVSAVLDDDAVGDVAGRYRDSDAYFFVGRATGHPVALEGALKLKEISYEHAEGFPAGELKHGPLALVTPRTPVFAVCTGEYPDKLRATVEEVRARGAPVVAVTTRALADVGTAADETMLVPDTHEELVGVFANVTLQLLSYRTATQLDRPVDKPRNLAKSVTVE